MSVRSSSGRRLAKNNCLWHRRGTYYPDISAVLKQHIPDGDDITVILDAHDIALAIPDLTFVSGDYNHIIRHIDIILAHTRITKMLPLGQFMPGSS